MVALFAAIALAAPATVAGDWINQDRSALVRVAPCGPQLCGTVLRVLARGPGVLRAHPLVGLRVLSGFARTGSRWTGGRAYDPKTGRSYRSTVELNRDGTLKVTGCVLFICRSQAWTRART